MLVSHLRYPGVTYSKFTKHCERIQKLIKNDDLNCVCKNELDKAFFAGDAAYSDNKDLATRTISDKVLKDETYDIATSPKYNGH